MPTFELPPEQTRASIGEISYHFADPVGLPGEAYGSCTALVLDENDRHILTISVSNLMLHLTTEEKQKLWILLTRLRTLAHQELIEV